MGKSGLRREIPPRRPPAQGTVPPSTSPARARLMSRIRQKGTEPELVVRRLARAAGLRVRLNGPALPGSPDLFSFRPARAVFVHGCFWHRHRACKAATTPKTHCDFWTEKFVANVRRDRRNT